MHCYPQTAFIIPAPSYFCGQLDEEDDRTWSKMDLAAGEGKEEHTVTLQLPPSSLLHPTAVVNLMRRRIGHGARWIWLLYEKSTINRISISLALAHSNTYGKFLFLRIKCLVNHGIMCDSLFSIANRTENTVHNSYSKILQVCH